MKGQGAQTSEESPPEPAEPVTQDKGPYWHSIPEAQEYLSVAYITQDGAQNLENLQGIKASLGVWLEEESESGYFFSGGLHFWMSYSRNPTQALWAEGIGLDAPSLPLGPVRIFPRAGLGITYRSEDPDGGFGGLGSLGLGTGIWVGHHWQLVLTVDRQFEFSAEDETQFGIEVRWAGQLLSPPLGE